MATRTIDSPRDRLITILIAPLAACPARLPVYLLLIAALVSQGTVSALTKAGILLSLYGLGIGLVASFAAREVLVSTMPVVYGVEDDEEAATLILP